MYTYQDLSVIDVERCADKVESDVANLSAHRQTSEQHKVSINQLLANVSHFTLVIITYQALSKFTFLDKTVFNYLRQVNGVNIGDTVFVRCVCVCVCACVCLCADQSD